MKKQFLSHIIAAIGTLLAMILVFLLLWFRELVIKNEEKIEDIVEVAFGDAEDGGGVPNVIPMDPITQVEQIPAPSAPAQPADNDLMVQDDEEALALAKQVEEQKKRKAQEEELVRKRKEEEARMEAERVAKEKALAEQKAKEQKAIDQANQFAALFGQAGTNEGANAQDAGSSSSSTQGNPVGKGYGSMNNSTWTLAGRSCVNLPKPSSDFSQSGRVVVNIMVDKQGIVTNATIGDGTTISDRATQQLALQAAKQAKFTEGNTTQQRGTIIYTFKLN